MHRSTYKDQVIQTSIGLINIPEFQNNVPIEILDPLWSRLTSSAKSLTRQLCKSFKKHIDSDLGCEICIDEKTFCGMRSVAPPASTIRVINLSPIYNPQMLISYPFMVSKLSLEGNINSENLLHILKLCKNLRAFQLTANYNVTSKSTDSNNFKDPVIVMRSLKSINVEGEFKKNCTDSTDNTSWQNIVYILRRIVSPNLESFRLQHFFDCPKEYLTSVDFLSQFLVKHNHTLNHLKLTLRKGYDCSHVHKHPYGQQKLALKVSDKELVSLDLETFIVYCDKPFNQVVDKMLESSNSLSKFEYDKPWGSWIFYSPILLVNSGTLSHIKISNAVPTLDMTSLGPCHNLKVLHLTKEQPSTDGKTTPNIINFEMLPTSLLELHLKNYSVDSLALLTMRKFNNLRSVDLQFLSSKLNPDTGVTASVVISLLSWHRKLNEIFIEEYNTHDTRLDFLNSLVREINMVPSPNCSWRLGTLRWILAIAPEKTLERWAPKLFVYGKSPLPFLDGIYEEF